MTERIIPDGVDRDSLAEFAACSLALKNWERRNFPAEGSPLAFDLVMSLGKTTAPHMNRTRILLKHLYLNLPYSEKGLRLQLRQLESNGIVSIRRSTENPRSAEVELTEAGWGLLHSYEAAFRLYHGKASNTHGF